MVRNVPLHHRVEGDGPPVVLGASLGTTLELWDGFAEELAGDHRVVRFDMRGHGGSPAPPGGYTMEELAADVVGLADDLGLDRFAYVGLSIGGAIGQVLGVDHGDRLTSLVLCGSAPRFGEPATWHERAALVRDSGLEELVEPTTARWFTAEFRAEQPDEVERVMSQFRSTPPEGYAGCCEALAGFDVTSRLGEIGTPTRVVVGSEDPTTTPSVAADLASAVPDADVVVVEGAAHIVNVGRPAEFASAVRAHLAATAP
jgi:3-oxoadipate enol-lactonase